MVDDTKASQTIVASEEEIWFVKAFPALVPDLTGTWNSGQAVVDLGRALGLPATWLTGRILNEILPDLWTRYRQSICLDAKDLIGSKIVVDNWPAKTGT